MISIIIIVKNDRGIENTLKKLVKIPKPEKTEILVVDASEGLLDDIKEKFPSVRWIYFHNRNSKKITIPEQRNLGIKNAKGDLIVFIDANCIPINTWLIEIVKPIKEDRENIIAGLVKSIGKESIWDRGQERVNSKRYGRECPTINMVFNKNIIQKIGYFDENFEAGEDIDFSWRAIDAGYKIRYAKKAIIYHDWGNLKQEIKRSFWYGQARVRLYKKHPNRLKNLLGYDSVVLFYPIYILLLPLTPFFPFYPLLIVIPLIHNIKEKNPFKIVFFHLVYGLGVLKEFFFPGKKRDRYETAHTKILIYPKDTNPYQQLLYRELTKKKEVVCTYLDTGFLGSHTLGLILLPFRLIKYKLRGYNIFHLHWAYSFRFPTKNKLFQNLFTRFIFSIYFIFFLSLLKLLKYKLVWTIHDILPHEKQFINDIQVRRFLSKICDAKIVHSKNTIREMQKLGLDTKNTYIIPHGNYISIYKNQINKQEACEYFGFAKEDFVFLFFGAIRPYKGIENLLKAFEQLIKEEKNVKLLIGGKCINKGLKKILNNAEKKFKKKIKVCTDYIEEDKVQYYFNCADVIVYSFNEITTSGSVILALSFKKPIICPRIGNLEELPGDIGFFYSITDKNGLLNCMRKAIANKKILSEMGRNAFEYAKSLSWDKIADKTYEVYEN